MPQYILGIYADRGAARRVIDALGEQGVPSADISLVVREKSEEDVSRRAERRDEDVPFPELAIHSAWERLGWQGGARPPYRDQVAPQIDYALLAAGPIAISIGGAQLGASAGGVVGTLADYGFELDLAREYYTRVVEGAALVMVRTAEERAAAVRDVIARFEPVAAAERQRAY